MSVGVGCAVEGAMWCVGLVAVGVVCVWWVLRGVWGLLVGIVLAVCSVCGCGTC